jgi:hypothetical protein
MGSEESDEDDQQPAELSEWNCYMQVPITSALKKENPLLWWKVCLFVYTENLTNIQTQKNALEYPAFARMAKDYLAIPATSTSVERLFSSSKHICTATRSALKAETITMAMSVKHWLRSGLISMDV